MEDNEKTTPKRNGDVHLTGLWDRLDGVCRKLWYEDRASAVSLQALVEEFRGEVDRAEQTIVGYRKALEEARKTLQQEIEGSFLDRLAERERELHEARDHAATLEAALKQERSRCDVLQQNIEAREAENLAFKDKFLKTEMQRDTERGQKMEAFYKELLEKSKQLESSWEDRRRELEAQYSKDEDGLRKKSAEQLEHIKQLAIDLERAYADKEMELSASFEKLRQETDGRESKCLKWEEQLRQKEEQLGNRTREMEASYQTKRHELDVLKARLQEEIASMVREYKGRADKPEGKK